MTDGTLSERVAAQRAAKAERAESTARLHGTGAHAEHYRREAEHWRQAAEAAKAGDTTPRPFFG